MLFNKSKNENIAAVEVAMYDVEYSTGDGWLDFQKSRSGEYVTASLWSTTGGLNVRTRTCSILFQTCKAYCILHTRILVIWLVEHLSRVILYFATFTEHCKAPKLNIGAQYG